MLGWALLLAAQQQSISSWNKRAQVTSDQDLDWVTDQQSSHCCVFFFSSMKSPFGQMSPWQPCRRGCSELVDGSQSGCYWLRGTWPSTPIPAAACTQSQERGRGGERLGPPPIPPLHLGCARKKLPPYKQPQCFWRKRAIGDWAARAPKMRIAILLSLLFHMTAAFHELWVMLNFCFGLFHEDISLGRWTTFHAVSSCASCSVRWPQSVAELFAFPPMH